MKTITYLFALASLMFIANVTIAQRPDIIDRQIFFGAPELPGVVLLFSLQTKSGGLYLNDLWQSLNQMR